MITKKQLKEIMAKCPYEISKEELSFAFGIFGLSIKEYQISKFNLNFEVHFRCTYIAKIRYGISKGGISFYNEFLNLCDGCHGITMGNIDRTADLIQIFINMFYDNLLAKAQYALYYDEETSPFDSIEQAQNYLKYAQSLMV